MDIPSGAVDCVACGESTPAEITLELAPFTRLKNATWKNTVEDHREISDLRAEAALALKFGTGGDEQIAFDALQEALETRRAYTQDAEKVMRDLREEVAQLTQERAEADARAAKLAGEVEGLQDELRRAVEDRQVADRNAEWWNAEALRINAELDALAKHHAKDQEVGK